MTSFISAAEEDDEEEGMLAVLLPPQVEQVGKLLRIQGNVNQQYNDVKLACISLGLFI